MNVSLDISVVFLGMCGGLAIDALLHPFETSRKIFCRRRPSEKRISALIEAGDAIFIISFDGKEWKVKTSL